nr:nuclease-related domain-containing protein [Lysinibacillus timonensis]
MAQLLKLQDYISRYQIDLNRYPAQFIRMKKNGWERVKQEWEAGELVDKWNQFEIKEELKQEQKERFSVFKKIFKKREKEYELFEDENNDTNDDLNNDLADGTTLFFEPNIVFSPQSIEELKRIFLDQFFHFQIKWASSTLKERSFVDPKFLRDSFLRTVLQKLPDNYLVFYYPVIKVKNAPVELDIMILTPLECLCITIVEHENHAVYVGNSERERFWSMKVGDFERKVLNPLIQLNRMESVITQLFAQNDVNIPIKKILLTRNGYFDYPGALFNVQFIDKREYPTWIDGLRQSTSPMKHMQILAAKTILNSVQTTSFNRLL